MNRIAPTTLAVLLLAAALPGCAGLFSREAPAVESAHAVFLTRPGCAYVVARTTGRGYAVLAPRDGHAPVRGDVLVGDLRTGRVALQLIPFPSSEMAGTASFDVAGHGLPLARAQDLWRDVCADG